MHSVEATCALPFLRARDFKIDEMTGMKDGEEIIQSKNQREKEIIFIGHFLLDNYFGKNYGTEAVIHALAISLNCESDDIKDLVTEIIDNIQTNIIDEN